MKIEYLKGCKVVALGPRRREALFPAIGRVEAYWEGLRDGRVMPARAEVDPRGIADVLEFAFVLEKIAPGLARIRLAGMHLNELMAMEVRGMPVSALFHPEARREIQSVLENVMGEPSAVRLALHADRGFARPALDAQMILLPMRDEAGQPTRVLGALQARGDIRQGPRRFAIHDVETKPLIGDALTAPAFRAPPRRFPMPAPGGRPRPTGPALRLVYDATGA